MEFNFPTQIKETISDLNQIRNLIKQMLLDSKIDSFCRYRFREVKRKYIYCICCQCMARLVYKKQNQQNYTIIKSLIRHKHAKQHYKKERIIQAIQEFPEFFSIKSIKDKIMHRFSISNATFYRYHKLAKCPHQNIDQVISNLEQYGIFGVSVFGQNQNLPDLILLTSEKMIQKYHSCQKIVRFDLTYNIIREKTESGGQFAVGAFVCLDNNLNIKPVCFVVMERETKEMFIRLFRQFFILMRSSPTVLISDEQRAIKYALNDLKESQTFLGQHYLDLFHVLRNIKNQLFLKQNMKYILPLIRSTNIYQYQKHYEICQSKLIDRDFSTLLKHIDKFKYCCLALLPRQIFIGLGSSTNCSEKLNDLIKSQIPFSQKYCTAVFMISKMFSKMILKQKQCFVQKSKVEKIFPFPQLNQLRMRVNKKVFKRILLEISLSMCCLINSKSNTLYQVAEEQFQQLEPFTVEWLNLEGRWACSCGLSEKIGIPCCHIIKILIFKKESIITAVHVWWLFQSNYQYKHSEQIPRPRKTRRSR